MTALSQPKETACLTAIQPGEAARLAALASYHLLDTPPDSRFDRFTRLAARQHEAPISLISLVDAKRQWFKSRIGLNVSETPRSSSFCAHALLAPHQVMVVENAVEDSRFAANPLVVGAPYIRFYAGAPIVTPDGHALGTLCIIDNKPRAFADAARISLQDLAACVAALLELYRSAAERSRDGEQDKLTGLFSRRHLTAFLDRIIRRQGEQPSCGLICLGLDHFKLVNAMHGFAAGDALLREAARRIKGTLRDGDVAARLGGDEFAVLLPGPVDAADAVLVASRLLEALQEPFTFKGEVLPVSVSAGCAVAPDDAADAETLLRRAHLALDDAKRGGRACLRHFSASQDHDNIRRQALEADLLAAVAAEDFHLVWQPIARLGANTPPRDQLTGFEALLRWGKKHAQGDDRVPGPAHGPAHGPEQFIPVAEDMQLIRRIDRMVLRMACQAASAWRNSWRVAVNVSGDWFRDDDLPAVLAATLRETGLDPARLEIEITEGMLIKDRERGLDVIRQIKMLGISVALDDFGSCYSSLSYVVSFPFDKIKLDRAFVNELGRNARAEIVTRAVLRLAEQLNTEVCAEGVETQEQLAFLSAEGCTLFQGYLIGRPARTPLAQIDMTGLASERTAFKKRGKKLF
jgi:diguanylate cyclase (GGDEF)-like protein